MLRTIFLATLLSAPLLFGAEVAFVKTNAPLYADDAGQGIIGNLVVSSKITVLEKGSEKSKVAFIGYLPEGSTIAYEKAGILMVGLEDISKPEGLEILGEVKDEYDTVWIETKAVGYVDNAALTESKDSLNSAGETLFNARCGSCHALHQKNEFDPNVWPSILDSMKGQAGLSKNENDLIIKFLQNQESH